MKCRIDNINNVLLVNNGRSLGRVYYLSRNIISKVQIIKLSDYFRLKKTIDKCISEFSKDKNMLFHYNIIFDSKIYLVVYCIKQQLEDENVLSKSDIFPVQFLINNMYCNKREKNSTICIIYKLSSSIYVIYSRKKSIIYSRIIDENSIGFVEEIVKKDIDMINNELEQDFPFIVISNVVSLKKSNFVLKYVEDGINVISV